MAAYFSLLDVTRPNQMPELADFWSLNLKLKISDEFCEKKSK